MISGFLRGVARLDIGVSFPLQLLYESRTMRNGLLSIAKNGSFHKSNNIVCFWWKSTVAPCEPRKQHIEYEREANSMRKVVVSEFVTLDGVIEDPGGAEGFNHAGWSFQFGSAEQQQFKVEELFKADALL